jgi:hypothetical protein
LISGTGHTSNKPADPLVPSGVCIPSPILENTDNDDTEEEWAMMLDNYPPHEYALVIETADAEAIEPCSLAEAKCCPDWLLWEKGIYEELETLHTAGTWELVVKPEGVNIIGSKWVFCAKKDTAGVEVPPHFAHVFMLFQCFYHPLN